MIVLFSRISSLCRFGRDLEQVADDCKSLALRELSQVFFFAFIPFFVGVFALLLRIDQPTVVSELLATIRSGGVYVISAALIAPIYFALRSDNDLPNRDAFLVWVIAAICSCCAGILLQQLKTPTNPIVYPIISLVVLLLVATLFFASAAFRNAAAKGSTAPTIISENLFSAEFEQAIEDGESR